MKKILGLVLVVFIARSAEAAGDCPSGFGQTPQAIRDKYRIVVSGEQCPLGWEPGVLNEVDTVVVLVSGADDPGTYTGSTCTVMP